MIEHVTENIKTVFQKEAELNIGKPEFSDDWSTIKVPFEAAMKDEEGVEKNTKYMATFNKHEDGEYKIANEIEEIKDVVQPSDANTKSMDSLSTLNDACIGEEADEEEPKVVYVTEDMFNSKMSEMTAGFDDMKASIMKECKSYIDSVMPTANNKTVDSEEKTEDKNTKSLSDADYNFPTLRGMAFSQPVVEDLKNLINKSK